MVDTASLPAVLHTVSADVGCGVGRQAIAAALPMDAPLNFLVNNAGVGMPDKIQDIALYDFEQALATNVSYFSYRPLCPSPRVSILRLTHALISSPSALPSRLP